MLQFKTLEYINSPIPILDRSGKDITPRYLLGSSSPQGAITCVIIITISIGPFQNISSLILASYKQNLFQKLFHGYCCLRHSNYLTVQVRATLLLDHFGGMNKNIFQKVMLSKERIDTESNDIHKCRGFLSKYASFKMQLSSYSP